MKRRNPLLQCALFVLMAWVLEPSPSWGYKMSQHTSPNLAYDVECGDFDGFAHWPSNQGTIYWYYNPAGKGAGKEFAFIDALETWTDAAESDHVLQYAGTTSDPFHNSDNKNTISWGDTSSSSLCGNTPCHAITIVRYRSSDQLIYEADIVFNNLMDWRTDGQSDACTSTGANTKVDTQGIATHELGHSLGLGHPATNEPSYPYATMGLASCSEEARDLHADDLEALQCSTNRYPLSPSYQGFLDGYAGLNCSQISGWAWNSKEATDPVYVNILDGSTLLDVVLADEYRADLVAAGKGNGWHGFMAPLPNSFKDGQWHTLRAQFSGTGGELTWSPKNLICDVELFPDGLQPAQDLSTGGTVYEVATQFSSSVSGKITALGYNFATLETGDHTIRLLTDAGVELANKPLSRGLTSYSYVTLDPPVEIQAGVLYRVSINTNTVQSKTACGLSPPLTNGPLTAHQGFWKQGAGGTPNISSCSNFHVSVRFDM